MLLKRKYPHIPFIFYISKRKYRVHFALGKALFTYQKYSEAIRDIKKFFEENKLDGYKFVEPILIKSIKWKFDYIIFRRHRLKYRLFKVMEFHLKNFIWNQ